MKDTDEELFIQTLLSPDLFYKWIRFVYLSVRNIKTVKLKIPDGNSIDSKILSLQHCIRNPLMGTNRVDTTVVKRCGQSAKNVNASRFRIVLM
jgi:hypothetical protein